MLSKAYIEITNVCNLSCAFCHGTARDARFLSVDDFKAFASALRPYTEYFYLHVLGEPLLHPNLDAILSVCDGLSSKVTVVTNGTLIAEKGDLLLRHPSLYKVAFSVHAYPANFPKADPAPYLSGLMDFADRAAGKCLIVYKFWNGGSPDAADNAPFLAALSAHYPEFTLTRGGVRLQKGVFVDFADRFVWPDPSQTGASPRFCMALRDQLAVLSDGAVVPCCLDADGNIPLGNLHRDTVEEILSSPRAKAIVKGFSEGRAVERLCQTCPFAAQKFGERKN